MASYRIQLWCGDVKRIFLQKNKTKIKRRIGLSSGFLSFLFLAPYSTLQPLSPYTRSSSSLFSLPSLQCLVRGIRCIPQNSSKLNDVVLNVMCDWLEVIRIIDENGFFVPLCHHVYELEICEAGLITREIVILLPLVALNVNSPGNQSNAWTICIVGFTVVSGAV